MIGENPTPYGILALWAVNGPSIVYWGILYIVPYIAYSHNVPDPLINMLVSIYYQD